jgi:hypothetical protein
MFAGQQWRFAAIPDSSIFGATANDFRITILSGRDS